MSGVQNPCPHHPRCSLTNLCRAPSCLKLLCPSCLRNHLDFHKARGEPEEIETLEEICESLSETVGQLNGDYSILQKSLDSCKDAFENSEEILMRNIRESRAQVISIVEEYFKGLENEAKEVLKYQSEELIFSLNSLINFVGQKRNEISSYLKKLKTPHKHIKYILKAFTTDFLPQSHFEYQESARDLETMNEKLMRVQIDDSKLYNLRMELAKFVYLKNPEIFRELWQAKLAKKEEKLNTNLLSPHNRSNILASPLQPEFINYYNPNDISFSSIDSDEDLNMTVKKDKVDSIRLAMNMPEKNVIKLASYRENTRSRKIPKRIFDVENQDYQSPKPINFQSALPMRDKKENHQMRTRKYEEKENFPRFSKPSEEKKIQNEKFEVPSDFEFQPILESQESMISAGKEKRRNLRITMPDYFTGSFAYLAYFLELSKNLYIFDVRSERMNRVNLQIPFLVPLKSRSVTTPNGKTLLLGGIHSVDSKSSSSSVYEFKEKTLIQHEPMRNGRANFACAYLDGYIYVCGGYSDGKVTNTCEKFSLYTNHWETVASAKYAEEGCTFVPFGEKFLCKLGQSLIEGEIEILDTRVGKWRSVPLKNHSKLSEIILSGGIQINSHEILVYGGLKENSESDSLFIIRIQEEGASVIDWGFLRKRGFSIEMPFILNSCVYMTMGTFKGGRDGNDRFGLRYDGENWREIF